jgi:phenylalanyl-tRNA synthetase beta chain
VENLFKRLKLLEKIKFSSCSVKQMNLQQSADIFLGAERIGFVGEVNDLARQKYQIKQKVFGSQISLSKIFDFIKVNEEFNYKDVSAFPRVERDLSFVFKKEIKASEAIEIIRNAGGESLVEIKIFDVYEGGEYQKNQQKSLAFHLIFQDSQKTLLGEEVEEIIRKITDRVQYSLGGKLREK